MLLNLLGYLKIRDTIAGALSVQINCLSDLSAANSGNMLHSRLLVASNVILINIDFFKLDSPLANLLVSLNVNLF